MKTILVVLLATVTVALAEERALIDTVTGEIVKIRTFNPEPKTNPQIWVKVVRPERLAFDPATETLQRTNILTSTNLTVTWIKRPLTTEELNEKAAREAAIALDEAENADRASKRARVGRAVATLRQWKVDADATVVTSGNAVATLQQLVNRFGKLSENLADLLEGEGIDE